MKMWRACTRLSKRRASEESGAFQSLVHQGFVYTCEEVYLGKKGALTSPNGNWIVQWFYTERDGMFIQIKQKRPYKIMFEYSDGNCFLNDDRESIRQNMTEMKDNLERLRDEMESNSHINPYNRKEGVISTALAKATF